ncbi:hypothetical protein [Kitasatospora sp. NPDC058046]|uniref:hypothetical protein n=1 Tax=Kitasatospora sp. NPDC058046 TaxID=3346312 RepID=UPI0036DB436C
MNCNQWLPAQGSHCGQPGRPYAVGPRCPEHTPAAQAGRPEPLPGPGYTPQRLLTPQYRLAQAATAGTARTRTTSPRRTTS